MDFWFSLVTKHFWNFVRYKFRVFQIRQPSIEEVQLLPEQRTLFSFMYPAQNKELLDALAARRATVFGMDCVPRISRAQVHYALKNE